VIAIGRVGSVGKQGVMPLISLGVLVTTIAELALSAINRDEGMSRAKVEARRQLTQSYVRGMNWLTA
jgi:hypothetical protein